MTGEPLKLVASSSCLHDRRYFTVMWEDTLRSRSATTSTELYYTIQESLSLSLRLGVKHTAHNMGS
jgi:hypothetical protein